MMSYRLSHRITACAVFLISLIQFLLTAQPSVPFWDPGELTAAAFMLQVPHPPGGPLFLLVARLFSMLPLPGNLGYRVNLVSVVSSAFAVLFLYLITVRVINNYRKKSPESGWESIATIGSAVIAALAFSFSDTFWFNGVESNYFAASTFLFSAITWLMMVWNDSAEEPGSGRYLILIGYLVGLSAGVHLMSVPSIFTVGLLITFRRFIDDEAVCRKSALILVGHIVVVLLVTLAMWSTLTSNTPPSYEETKAYDLRYLGTIAVVSLLYMGVFWKSVFNRNSIYLALAVGGVVLFAAYPGVVKLLPKFLHLASANSTSAGLIALLAVLGVLGYLAYWLAKRKVGLLESAAVALIAAILGFTTYTTILIRANADPPMNENQPKTFDGLLTYLNREQYGDFPIFKRRWSPEGRHRYTWTNYKSDLDFFWNYQIDHMYNRYVEWNFIGRQSFDQDAGVNWKELYGIPFFMGLLGLYLYFRKNWRMATVFLVLFVFMGYFIAFYQNQQEMQPRDRDYFYCGSYMIFALWIGLGIRGLIDLLEERLKKPALLRQATAGVLLLAAIVIPVRMAQVNYPSHDRSRNWIPWDFSYNLLQSCSPNSILFTNGDNDTFPLWYLQDVEGIRRDVRIVNLSLVNTPWYIRQLKSEEPYGTAKVKISYSDAEIDRLSPVQWQTQVRKIPVPADVAKSFSVTDSATLANGYITYTVTNSVQYGGVKAVRIQDLMVIDIVEHNAWERPIYFATTCSEDTKNGLGDYLRMEGLASQLVPQKRRAETGVDYVDEPIMHRQLFDDSTWVFSKTYRPGMRFRGLNDPKVFLDENMQLMTRNYRSTYVRLALQYIYVDHTPAEAVTTLDRMETVMPRAVNAMDFRMLFDVATLYQTAGANTKYTDYLKEAEEGALESLRKNPNDYTSFYNPYRILTEIYERTGRYNKAADVLEGLLKVFPRNQQLVSEIQRYRRAAAVTDSILGRK